MAQQYQINRRKFISQVSKASLVSYLPLPLLADSTAAVVAETDNFLTKPYLQNLTTSAVTVMWITDKDSLSWVEIKEDNAATSRKVFQVKNGLVNSGRINQVKVENLKPGTSYQYKVYSKEIEEFKPYKVTYGATSELGPFPFKTLSGKETEVKFLVFNDLHDHPETITDLAGKINPQKDYDFVVFNGDAFDYIEDEARIVKDLLKPANQVFSTETPFLMVQGNHEVRGKFARDMFNYFDYPAGLPYYAFTQGPVRFIVLDSGEDKDDEVEAYAGLVSFDDYRREQGKWLEAEIKSEAYKKAKFKVVFLHIPVFHSGDWHGPMHCREVFHPIFTKGKIDMLISGHTHKFGTYPANAGEHNYPVIIGGGPKEGNRTLMKVKVTAKQLDLEMFKDDGSIVGKHQIKKA